jgi:lambda family phage portal protein
MKKAAPKGIIERTLNRLGFVKKRAQELGYQAAAINRLTNNWSTSTLSIDSIAQTQLVPLRARCRILADQNDYAVKFLRMVRNNVIGPDGIQLKNKAMDPPNRQTPKGRIDQFANRMIEDAWWQFGKRGQCTVDRSMSLCDLENLAIETIARDGEILIRKVRGFDNANRYALQLLECDYLDVEKNEKLPNGNEIRMGVEINRWREPVAYWLRQENPNDTFRLGGNRAEWERVEASEMIHAFIKVRPEQTRGIPWMAAGAYRLNMLGKYEEAEVTAARTAASKMAFLVKTNANQEYQGETEGNNKLMDAEPGAIEELPYGMDLKTLDWNHPNSSYQVFMKTCLRGVAGSFGVSYNMLANDMESVNFASGRLGLEEERDGWKVVQRWFIDAVLNEVFRDWLEVQLMTQKIALPFSKFEKFNAPDWRPRRWSYISPEQDTRSKIDQVKAGFTSVSRVLAEQGFDRDEVFAEIAEDNAAAEELDIELPAITDPYIEVEKEKVEAQAEASGAAEASASAEEERSAEKLSRIICESHQSIAKTSQDTARQMAELLLAGRKKTHKITGRDDRGQINAIETVEE